VRRQKNGPEILRTLGAFNHRYWRFCFRSTDRVGELGPMHARPRNLAERSLEENGDHKTGHDAMGPPASFQDGWHTTNVQDGRHTISIMRNFCQSGLSIFQNRRRVSADNWALQSGRNRQSLEALRAIQRC